MPATVSPGTPRLSARLRDLSTLVALGLALLTLAPPAVILLRELGDGPLSSQAADAVGKSLVRSLPAFFYILALWRVRAVFCAMAKKSRAVPPQLAGSLQTIGWILAWGAAMDVFGWTLLLRWIDGEPGGAVAHYNPAAFAIGVVGLALVMLARVLDRAAEMQSELDQII
jgi:hypothetical protein